MKKLFLISVLLLSFNGWAENYSCRINEVFKGSNGQLDGVVTIDQQRRKLDLSLKLTTTPVNLMDKDLILLLKLGRAGISAC